MKKKKIKILIADSNYLICKGLHYLLSEFNDFEVVAEAVNIDDLFEKLPIHTPDLLVIDYSDSNFKLKALQFFNKKYPNIPVLAITQADMSPTLMSKALSVCTSHLLKDCDKEEIIEALYQTFDGKRFLCGKIVDRLVSPGQTVDRSVSTGGLCSGLNVTSRELEIIKLIAEGLANKEIAEKLFLSTHTVTTHRKNIMSKLGVNNTAGVVMFAVQENLLAPNKYLFG